MTQLKKCCRLISDPVFEKLELNTCLVCGAWLDPNDRILEALKNYKVEALKMAMIVLEVRMPTVEQIDMVGSDYPYSGSWWDCVDSLLPEVMTCLILAVEADKRLLKDYVDAQAAKKE